MPRFEPFAGVRYDLDRVDLDDVVAPPYDVIGPDEQAALEARSPYNVVRIDLAREENGRDRYNAAGCLFDEWLAQGILRTDPEPGFYAYRMGYHDPEGRSRQIVGVLGALEVSAPDEGGAWVAPVGGFVVGALVALFLRDRVRPSRGPVLEPTPDPTW